MDKLNETEIEKSSLGFFKYVFKGKLKAFYDKYDQI